MDPSVPFGFLSTSKNQQYFPNPSLPQQETSNLPNPIIQPIPDDSNSNALNELPEIERRAKRYQADTEETGDGPDILCVHPGGRKIETNNSHSPLLRKSQESHLNHADRNEIYKRIINGEVLVCEIESLENKNTQKRDTQNIYNRRNYKEHVCKSEIRRCKPKKNNRVITTKPVNSKTIQKHKEVSSPNYLARMIHNQTNSASKTSTPVSKTQSTSFKTQIYNSCDKNSQITPSLHPNLSQYQKHLPHTSILTDPLSNNQSPHSHSLKSSLPVLNPPPGHLQTAPSPASQSASKPIIPKKKRLKREISSGLQPGKFQKEFARLKQKGDLKFLPKLLVDTPFCAERVKFKDRYNETDPKWAHRFVTKEDFLRREERKIADKILRNAKIVYDYVEKSPFYKELSQKYIDEKLLIQSNNKDNSMNKARLKMRSIKRNALSTGFPSLDNIYTSLNPYYVLQGEEDSTLVFESRFESGNLRKVAQLSEFEYELYLRNDYNSQNYTQWYFFKCTNIKAGVKYTFHLKNFQKPDSLYNQGMKPLVYSTKKVEEDGIGWYRGGENICYYQNSTKKSSSGYMFSLSFEIEFPFDNDEVYLCHSFPFTYRDCKEHLEAICVDNEGLGRVNMKSKIRKTEMCKSLAGNSLDLVIITNFNSSELDISKRKAIIITGRVHPGESNSSFVVQGILDYLVSDNEAAKQLRNKYVFKIIPMLNPDGVILGNYRCSLSGQDLNRQWIGPTSRMFPEIYNTKLMFKKTLESRQIFLYIDCHGHSRKKNIFMYGCKSNDQTDKTMKVFPYMMSESNGSFSFDDCNFNVQKDRESTGRVVVNREYSVKNSFTLEASFFGPDIGKYKGCHFTPAHLRNVGKSFCIALNESSTADVVDSVLETLNKKKTKKNLE
ncbi:unnamed protein product [Moneuplotes crassus]|uniref:Peptidase M14 domain-containing protein n=1 Tax=Euplotes crassus TaxID=5936 RepID=A0AAD2D0R7_EUPCR|nr:unnamed protein product [Moneuplotes crassus]